MTPALSALPCLARRPEVSVKKGVFGILPDGREAPYYTLENGQGMTLTVTSYGCRILKLLTKDKNGNLGDVVLGHNSLPEYYGSDYQGAFVGRYANRIGGAAFELDGKTITLSANDGKNSLHGGPNGYHQVLWSGEATDGEEPSIIFTHLSPDGDEGYPGNLQLTVSYTLTKENELVMEYRAVSDQKTPFNPTNHSFFNLSADPQKDVLGTWLSLEAKAVTAVSDDLIPVGELVPVTGTPLDFTSPKKLGDDMFADDHLIRLCGGFDHNFCVEGTGFRKIAKAWEPESGRTMEVFSDMPGVQLYTFNKVDGPLGKDGKPMKPHSAFCLETQFYPDSVHYPEFPFRFLQPGEPFYSKTVYRFSIE